MQIDLREIINIPGGKVSFDYSPNLSGLETGSVKAIKPNASGTNRDPADHCTMATGNRSLD